MEMRFDNLLEPSVGVYFEQQLRNIRQEVIEDAIPPRNSFRFFPQNTQIESWRQTYEHRMYEPIGVAQFISDYADDLPLVDIATRQEIFNLRSFGCAYQFSVEEIEASAATGMQLRAKRARSARLVTEQKFNQIQWYGDTSSQLFGLTNYPYIPRFFATVDWSSASATADDIRQEMNDAVNSIFDLTETIADTFIMLVPPAVYTNVTTRPWSTAAGDTTILAHFLANNPFIKDVQPAWELKAAGPSGGDLVAIFNPDPNVFEHALARPFTQLAPQAKNLAIVTPTHAKSGGIACDRPLEMLIVELP